MRQILHIFKKDVRHHWPEILLSIALLVLFARQELLHWQRGDAGFVGGGLRFLFSDIRRLSFLGLILSWILLPLRAIQGETLVGDRQWWITKPYIWWKLLLAKLLFPLVFILFPAFLVQLLFLYRSQFPILPHILGAFEMLLSVFGMTMACSFFLAVLTRNLGQAFIGVGLAIGALALVIWIGDLDHPLEPSQSPWIIDKLEMALFFIPFVAIPIGQFALRRTSQARSLAVGCFLVAALLGLPNFANHFDRDYPVLPAEESPLQLTLPFDGVQLSENSFIPSNRDANPTKALTLNFSISRLAPSTLLEASAIKLEANLPDGSVWHGGWRYDFKKIHPGDDGAIFTYQLKTKDAEKLTPRPVNLRVELLIEEYSIENSHTLFVRSGLFRDPLMGDCRMEAFSQGSLKCYHLLAEPKYLALFDALNSPCQKRSDTNQAVEYDSNTSGEAGWSPGINPMTEYNLRFPSAALCSGAQVQLFHPNFQHEVRLQFSFPNVRILEGSGPSHHKDSTPSLKS